MVMAMMGTELEMAIPHSVQHAHIVNADIASVAC